MGLKLLRMELPSPEKRKTQEKHVRVNSGVQVLYMLSLECRRAVQVYMLSRYSDIGIRSQRIGQGWRKITRVLKAFKKCQLGVWCWLLNLTSRQEGSPFFGVWLHGGIFIDFGIRLAFEY